MPLDSLVERFKIAQRGQKVIKEEKELPGCVLELDDGALIISHIKSLGLLVMQLEKRVPGVSKTVAYPTVCLSPIGEIYMLRPCDGGFSLEKPDFSQRLAKDATVDTRDIAVIARLATIKQRDFIVRYSELRKNHIKETALWCLGINTSILPPA